MELTEEGLERFFLTVLPHLDERQRRVTVGAMAEVLGRGGQAARGGVVGDVVEHGVESGV